jgi:hypothetical protein
MVQPFADIDWILADKFLSDEVYAQYYIESTKELKIVDNSVTELGEPLDLKDLLKVYNDVKGTWIVSPDWIGDKKRTLAAYPATLKELGPGAVIGVLQGSTPKEALECLGTYDCELIAVPYRVGGSIKGDPSWLMALRRQLVVSRIPEDRLVHLLGFTTSDEFTWYRGYVTNVVSLDTDVPVRAGLLNSDYEEFDRTQDTKEVSLDRDNWGAVCRNIALLRKHMS